MADRIDRRFGHVFQIDKTLHGTPAQRQALRDAYDAPYGSKPHALLQNFDRYFNRRYPGRHYVNLEIKDFGGDTQHLELAGAASIAFSDKLVPTALRDLAQHSFFHVLDNTDYLDQADRQWFMSALGVVPDWNGVRETFADAGRDWWNGVSWQSLDSILLKGRDGH